VEVWVFNLSENTDHQFKILLVIKIKDGVIVNRDAW